MPANEKTWRDQKLMHLVFGVSSTLMLLTTLWMLAADHDREWKDVQAKFIDLESQTTRARLHQQVAGDYERRLRDLEAIVEEQKQRLPEVVLVRAFVAQMLFHRANQQPAEEPNGGAEARREAYAELERVRDEALGQRKLIGELEVSLAALEKSAHRGRKAELQARLDEVQAAFARTSERLRARLDAVVPRLEEALGGEQPEQREFARLTEPFDTAEAGQRAALRESVLAAMSEDIAEALFQEERLQRDLKFRRADLDVARSEMELAFGAGASPERVAVLQEAVDQVQADVQRLTLEHEAFNLHRKNLDAILAAIDSGVREAAKTRDDYAADVERLRRTLEQVRDKVGKHIVTMPILDAFNNTEIEIKQNWLPELTINYNLSDVARFDRCTTCHLGIDKTAPGSASAPAYDQEHRVEGIALATPDNPPQLAAEGAGGNPTGRTAAQAVEEKLLKAYGLRLAEQGVFDDDDVTIEFVLPRTASAMAGLRQGDVLAEINGVKIINKELAIRYLLERVRWGEPLTLAVRRGVPQPFSTHPRLDLFGGSTSPHPFAKVGCTICHDGQGSATAFKWASHAPNTLIQMQQWTRKHGWFYNHHWIYPMLADRFQEAYCLKCHHEVTALEPSDRFPEPPAPKLVEGFNTIRKFGCFGCHEINGYKGPDDRVGPDLRLEPNYTAAAQQLHVNGMLSPAQKRQRVETIFGGRFSTGDDGTLVTAAGEPADGGAVAFARQLQETTGRIIEAPWDDEARHALEELLKADEERSKDPARAAPVYLDARMRSLRMVLANVETPGRERKVGPSLRRVASKVGAAFIYDWLMEPTHFRPSTRMPRFFGLHSHLKLKTGDEQHDDEEAPKEPARTARYETIEALGMTEYLLSASQPFAYMPPREDVEPARADRGKYLFQTRGCLACHAHADFPQAVQDQGPDLSNVGSKLDTPIGRRWLYTWLRNPMHYHPRTKMPDTFLVPIEHRDAEGNVTMTTDPAADIAAYLLASKNDWQPVATPDINNFPDDLADALKELALESLRGAFTRRQALNYLETGIPPEMADELKGDEIELVGRLAGLSGAEKQRVWLRYVGRRAVTKYGCSGCHDIPRFEDAKTIGTALAGWGRKETSKLAFEQIVQYLARTEGESHGENGQAADEHGGEPHLDLRNMRDRDKAFFLAAVMNHQREGFLWQKLRDPRSYDFKKTRNKSYNERLKMPRFQFHKDRTQNAAKREALMTFILGLVSEPPARQYLYHPPPRQQAVDEGRRLLDKYNCGGCHTLGEQQFAFEFDPEYPDYNGRDFLKDDYPIFQPQLTPEQIAASRQVDRRGMGHAQITARPARNDRGEIIEVVEDDEENPLLFFELWQPALINGEYWPVGEQVPIPKKWLLPSKHQDAVGGYLARLIQPVVLERERETNPAAKYSDAWGRVPPPLIREGVKVQNGWLHDFLLNPYEIRPAAVLRMPRFNMSPDEATALANYFSALEGVEYPYETVPQRQQAYLDEMRLRFPGRLQDALTIVTNGNYCIKCHLLGDYAPAGSTVAQAPNLDRIYQRLRPEFLQKWLANPKRMLPYTGMPVNFPKNKPIDPKLFEVEIGPLVHEGTAPEQLQAVVDLLLNYDRYMESRQSIKPLIQEAPMPEAEAADAGE